MSSQEFASKAFKVAVVLWLAALVFWRISSDLHFVDYRDFWGMAAAAAEGKELYAYVPGHAVVFPAYCLFFLPLYPLGLKLSALAFIGINLALAIWMMHLIYIRTRRVDGDATPRTGLPPFSVIVIGLLILNTSPVLHTIRNGQTSILIGFFLVLVFLGAREGPKPLWLSIPMMLKYTFGLFALLFMSKGRVYICVWAFVLFLLWGLSPVVFGLDLVEVYSSYRERLTRAIGGSGINTYTSHGASMVQIGFLKSNSVNVVLELIFLAAFAIALRREMRKDGLSVNALLLTGCTTMVIVYHRIYDLVILMPLLALFATRLRERKRWLQCAIATGFFLFFLTPQSIILKIAGKMGESVGHNRIFEVSAYKTLGLSTVIPINAISMLLLAGFSVYLYFFEAEIPISVGLEDRSEPTPT